MKQKFFTAAEVCKLAGIAKSTLFRWEKEPWFPVVARQPYGLSKHGERVFTSEDCYRIMSKKFQKRFQAAAGRKDLTAMGTILEEATVAKLCLTGDRSSFLKLREYTHFLPETLTALAKTANDYDPSDPRFRETLQLVLDKTA